MYWKKTPPYGDWAKDLSGSATSGNMRCRAVNEGLVHGSQTLYYANLDCEIQAEFICTPIGSTCDNRGFRTSTVHNVFIPFINYNSDDGDSDSSSDSEEDSSDDSDDSGSFMDDPRWFECTLHEMSSGIVMSGPLHEDGSVCLEYLGEEAGVSPPNAFVNFLTSIINFFKSFFGGF